MLDTNKFYIWYQCEWPWPSLKVTEILFFFFFCRRRHLCRLVWKCSVEQPTEETSVLSRGCNNGLIHNEIASQYLGQFVNTLKFFHICFLIGFSCQCFGSLLKLSFHLTVFGHCRQWKQTLVEFGWPIWISCLTCCFDGSKLPVPYPVTSDQRWFLLSFSSKLTYS